MLNKIKKVSSIIVMGMLGVILFGCFEDHYVEPIDPFQKQRLEKDPAVFVFNAGDKIIRMKTNHANISTIDEGLRIKGSMFTEHEMYGDVRLTNGDFVMFNDKAAKKAGDMYSSEYGDLKISSGLIQRIYGDTVETYTSIAAYGLLDMPKLGMLNKIDLPINPTGGEMLWGTGASFKANPSDGSYFNPLNDDRYYFVIKIQAGTTFSISEGNASMDAGAGVSAKLAIDPSDPFFYFRGDLTNTPVPISTGGFGFSIQGFLNYTPRVDEYDQVKSFDNGYIYILGDIPIPLPDPLPTLSIDDAEGVIHFAHGDHNAPIAFFDLIPVSFDIGANGSLAISEDIIPGFLSYSVTLAKASSYTHFDGLGDAQFSWIGAIEAPAADPNQLVFDFLQTYGEKLGLGGSLEFLKYLKITADIYSGDIVDTKTVAKYFGTASTNPLNWEMGMAAQSSISLPLIGEIAAGEAMFQWSLKHIKFAGIVDIGGFMGVDMLGEFQFTNADFRLMGHGYVDISGDWSVVGFKLAMELLADIYKENAVFGFHGIIYLEGKFWADVGLFKITVGAKFRVEILIESDGSFKFCFEIGIGPVGFDVCIDYSSMDNGNMLETITMTEIPIENVPQDMRFEPEDGPVKLGPDYQHSYGVERVTKRIIQKPISLRK